MQHLLNVEKTQAMEIENEEKIISYLTFKLQDELYAANVSKVLNILELTKITKVPNAPNYMKGVINLRGDVLPVIDTRLKFGMKEVEYTSSTCILVLILNIDGSTIHLGALVDSVQEVLEIEDKELLPPPSIGLNYKSDFIQAIVEYNDDFIMILDVEKVFTGSELEDLNVVDKKGDQLQSEEVKVEIKELREADRAILHNENKSKKIANKTY